MWRLSWLVGTVRSKVGCKRRRLARFGQSHNSPLFDFRPYLGVLALVAPMALGPTVSVADALAPPPAGSPLVVPGVQTLDGGQQELDQRQAQLSSTEAVQAREASQTEYEGLNGERAEQVAGEAFPEVVKVAGGGPPRLPQGQTIVEYPSADAARVDLGDGRRAVIDSTEPMSTVDSSGQRVPVDLTLSDVGGAFEPRAPLVALRIPKQLHSGVRLPGAEVSLVPLDQAGAPVGGSEGTVDGAAVFFAGTGTDAGALVKPIASGFDLSTLLFSQRSPEQLSFRVEMPPGASLVQQQDGSVAVLEGSRTLAVVDAPSAHDAEGTAVPASMSLTGDTLTIAIEHSLAAYRLPVIIDPTVREGGEILFNEPFSGTWGFLTEYPGSFSGHSFEERTEHGVEDVGKEPSIGQRGVFGYGTQGESRIYEITADTSSNAGAQLQDVLGIYNVHSESNEGTPHKWIGAYSEEATVCALPECATGTITHGVNDESEAFFEQTALENAFPFTSKMTFAYVYILQETGPTTSFDTTDETVEGYNNAQYAGHWVKTNGFTTELAFVNMHDPGTGISEQGWSSPGVSGWGEALRKWPNFGCAGVQCNECGEVKCGGEPIGLNLYGLSDGEDAIETTVKDAVGLSATAKGLVKIDNTAPYAIGLSGLPPGNEIGYGHYRLNASATDGSGKTPSSGVASIALAVDGKEIGKPSGSCSPGPCKATGEWTLEGAEYVAGRHTITVTATDGAGNSAKEEFTLSIHSAESASAGPGSVELATGALTLSSSDVAIASPGAGLAVQRSYDSRNLTLGGEGPLGPQWSGLSLSGSESLKELPTGSMVLTAASGQQSLFALEGGKFVSPTGDGNLTLSKEGTGVFALKDQSGNVTTFTVPSGGSGTTLTPSRSEEDGGTHSTTYSFQTVEGITEPTQALAPVAAGAKCATLVAGCRALKFAYAKTTTATGEAPGEWGEYKGRIASISFTAWDPAHKEMTTTAVAQYSFDRQGRLRAEWDPRISPALKTVYGYDAEGHVTSVTPPGQQPWLFTYGTTSGDTHSGRLLTVVRPSASISFGSGEAPKDKEVPTLSTTTPIIGSEMTVSTGSWGGGPLTYGYQWEECNATGGECAAIPGASNRGYTPRYVNEGHTLAAAVTAINAAGAVTISTATSSLIALQPPAPAYDLQMGGKEWGLSAPTYDAIYKETVYIANTANNQLEAFTTGGKHLWKTTSSGGGIGQLKGPTGVIVLGQTLYVADSGNKRIAAFNLSGEYLASEKCPGTPVGLAAHGEYLYTSDETNNRIDKFLLMSESRFPYDTYLGESIKDPSGIGYANNALYVSEAGASRVQEFNLNGKLITAIGSQGKGPGQFKGPEGVGTDPAGNIWVADTGNDRVEEFNSQGKYVLQFGTEGSKEGQFVKPVGVVLPNNEEPYVVDSGNNRVERFLPGKRTEIAVPPAVPPNPGTNAVTTFEYQVPVSGTGAPFALGSSETAAWAQKDDPVEATAVYPPDEPMGWPAEDYRRATIYYRDDRDRTVNVASPAGGISTTEYNSTNDVVRTLTPDNRQSALAEGGNSVKVAQLLDTHSAYNGEGTEAEETVGPQHTVKLSNGSEVLARHRTRYFYDEGAPKGGGPYGLVTKTTEGAQLSGGEEEDVRTTATEYGGQGNLGWKLRAPTAIVTDPNGLKITTTTTYDPTTGNTLETKMPAGSEGAALPVFNLKFGGFGSKEGQFEAPWGVAVDQKSANVYVSDYGAGRIEEFTAGGSFLASIGSKGSGEGQLKAPEALAVSSAGNLYVGDSGNHRITEFNSNGKYLGAYGKEGTGEGQFSGTIGGLATDSSGDIWVSDSSDNRVEELNSQGKYIRAFGKEGAGEGQFNVPLGLTIAGGDLYVADFNNNRIQEFNLEGKYLGQFGGWGAENGHLKEPWAIAADAEGDLYVSDRGPDRVQEFTAAGKFFAWLGAYGSGEGQFNDPDGIATGSTGALYVVDSGNYRVDEWTPGNQGARTRQTVYYTAESKSSVPACASHPEWAGLPCQTQPAAQPETAGLPNLPVTTVVYNIWDEPETSTETVGASTRTTKIEYDAAGRPLTTSIKSSIGTPVPTVTDKYNAETGALVEQGTTSEGKTQTLTSVYNSLGQLVSSTDADGNEATIGYDVDGRQEKVYDGKGTQTFHYDATTGAQTKVTDSEAGTFTATYDAQGTMLSESYPNGLKANYTYDSTGQPTSLEYIKASHCGTSCIWYTDHVTPSISGQWVSQTSSLSTQAYAYDAAGRLIQAQDTPSGQDCTTHNYSYDADTNRTNTATIASSNSKCLTEGGTSETHGYDTADRLTDSGVVYDSFGNITKLTSQDAGGGELTSTYYATSKLASQTQSGETLTYNLDPAGRTRETVATGTTNSTTILHYAGGGSAPVWTSEPLTGDWTRNISYHGTLAATQTNGGEPVFQLTDLHGDVIATAGNEAQTKLLSTVETNEYGVPSGTPPKYSWLGAGGVSTEFASGVLATGVRSYIPQIGRFLQTDPVPGGSANAYAYTYGDPVNTSDPSGEYTYGGPSAALMRGIARMAAAAVAERAALNAAAAAAAAAKIGAANSAGALNNPSGSNGLEYSDPVGCRVEPDEITAVSGHEHLLNISGYYACAAVEGGDLAELSVEIELCVEKLDIRTELWESVKCTARVYHLAEYPARKIDFTFECVPGELYQTWIAGFGRGGSGVWTKEGWDEESNPYIC